MLLTIIVSAALLAEPQQPTSALVPIANWRVEPVQDTDLIGKSATELGSHYFGNAETLGLPFIEGAVSGHQVAIYLIPAPRPDSGGRCYGRWSRLVNSQAYDGGATLVFVDGTLSGSYRTEASNPLFHNDATPSPASASLPLQSGFSALANNLRSLYVAPSTLLGWARCEPSDEDLKRAQEASRPHDPPAKISPGALALGIALSPLILPIGALGAEALHEQHVHASRDENWRAESERLLSILALGSEVPGGAAAFAEAHKDRVRWAPAADPEYGILYIKDNPQGFGARLLGVRAGQIEWRGGSSYRPQICAGNKLRAGFKANLCGKNSVDFW